VSECFLIELTETETKEAMDDFIDAMAKILEEANTNPETVRRLDGVKAAKELFWIGLSDSGVLKIS